MAATGANPKWAAWREEVAAYDALLAQVVEQTRRGVLGGETVPAQDKANSLFEPQQRTAKLTRATRNGWLIGCGTVHPESERSRTELHAGVRSALTTAICSDSADTAYSSIRIQ